MELPKAMFITASAASFSTAQAAFTLPALWRAWNSSQAAFCPSGPSPWNRYTG